MKNLSPEAIETSLGALREIKCRIKRLSDPSDRVAPVDRQVNWRSESVK